MPGDLGPHPQHGAGKGLLDGHPMRGFLMGPVQPVLPAVRGKARFGRDARAGDEQHASCPTHRLDGVVDGSHVVLRECRKRLGSIDLG